MKILKILAIVLAFSICFTFAGCSNKKHKSTVKNSKDNTFDIDDTSNIVEAVFVPDLDENSNTRVEDIDQSDMASIKEVMEKRLLAKGITKSEVRADFDSKKIFVSFPHQGEGFDHVSFVEELVGTAEIIFTNGREEPAADGSNIVLQGAEDIESAVAEVDKETGRYTVQLTFTKKGSSKFAVATEQIAATMGVIGIWLRNENDRYELISAPMVNSAITDGKAIISGDFDAEKANELAAIVNSASIPFSFSSIQIKYPSNQK